MSVDKMSHEYELAGYPKTVGDRYYAQDMVRDHWHLKDKVGRMVQALFRKQNPMVSVDGDIALGAAFNLLDIPAFDGFALYDVDVPDDFSSVPPTVKVEQVMLQVSVPSITDFDIAAAGATMDGVTTNYIKAQYEYIPGSTRDRAVRPGNYSYELADGYFLTCNATAPTLYDVVLGTVVSDGATFTTYIQNDPDFISGGTGGGLQVGEVVWYAGVGAIESDKLSCDGTIHNIADYPKLFGKLGTTWGGDGITTFGVPNLSGIYPGMVGTQDINGRTKGNPAANIGDILEDQMQNLTGEVQFVRNGIQEVSAAGAFAESKGGDGASGYRLGPDNGYAFGTLRFDSADSPDARTGDHTDVSRAIGRWIIQAEPQEPATLNSVVVDVEIGDTRWIGHDTIGPFDMVCDGRSLATLEYPDLFAKLQYKWGGSGANFNIPNLQGIHPGAIGSQDINGNTKGDPTHIIGEYKEDQMEQITGNLQAKAIFSDYAGGIVGAGALKRGSSGSLPRPDWSSNGSGLAVGLDTALDSRTFVDSLTPGDYTDVSRAMGQWIIRVKQPADYIIKTLNEFSAVISVDTTLADYDAAADLAEAHPDGFMILFRNTGTGMNHIINLPDSITLGDAKSLRLTRFGSDWIYEDVVIDEYTDNTIVNEENTVTKWAGGRMTIESFLSKSGSQQTVTYPEPFISTPRILLNLTTGNANSAGINSITVNGHNTIGYDSGSGSITVDRFTTATGRWKTGV